MIRKKVKHIYFKSFIDNADIINTHNYFTSYSEFFIIKYKYKLSLDCLDQIRYLTGYAGGIKRKEKLLEIEGIHG